MRFVNIIKQESCYLLLFVPLVSFILLSSQVQAFTNNANLLVEFSDIGTMTLNAEAVPLGTLLEKIQEKISMEFEIPEKLLKQPISVSFKSQPLTRAISRVLRGVSYSCVFDSNGNVKKIIVLPNASKDKDFHIDRKDPRPDIPHERAMEITPPFELEDLMEAIESIPLPQVEDMDAALEATPPGEVVKNLVEAIKDTGGTPPPELEELIEGMEEAAQLGLQSFGDGWRNL